MDGFWMEVLEFEDRRGQLLKFDDVTFGLLFVGTKPHALENLGLVDRL